MTPVEIRHFHLFCGLGAGAKGFNRAQPRVGNLQARFRCLGGIDVDPAAVRDFKRLTGVAGTLMDLFDRDQYRDFHDQVPPAEWREATPADIQRAAGGERPHIVFLSAPCKGFSGLLSESRSRSARYQALNRLTLRGVWLMLEAWKDEPPELIVFENVPRIATRGRHLLDQIVDLLRAYGYAVAETTHDCGELGGLAQSRKRFLLVARHIEKVPPFLYEPEKRPLQAVGTVLGRMLLPGDLRAGPMHRVPALQWKTWVRLAFVEAGSDWRSLNRLAVEDGVLRDYLLMPEMHRGGYCVRRWDETMGVVAGASRPGNGAFSVADPRVTEHPRFSHAGFRVLQWDQPAGTVTGGANAPGSSAQQVADPRTGLKHNNCFRVVRFDQHAGTVTGGAGPSAGGQAVADPRPAWDGRHGHMHVTEWHDPSRTVTAGGKGVQGGWLSIADPRVGMDPQRGAYLTGGHYGVIPWSAPSGAVSSAATHDNGRWSVADPRGTARQQPRGCYPEEWGPSHDRRLTCACGNPDPAHWERTSGFPPSNEASKVDVPAADEKLVALISAEDGTWHRPFTTLELAALQSLVDPEEQLELDGLSDSAWRERIGNAVPPAAAEAIAHLMGTTLLLAWSGETFILSAQPIWVRPIALGLTLPQQGAA